MEKIKIVFLAANPKDTTTLRLGEEVREIEEALRRAKHRDRFELLQQWALRVADLQGHLLRHDPRIVHFSGHGSAKSEIILEDRNGNSKALPVRELSELFRLLKGNIRCVVLNACFSAPQAKAIAKHIDCVIGMSRAIADDAAVDFASAFYEGLGYGKDVFTAFMLGCNRVGLEKTDDPRTPKLLIKRGVDPAKVTLT